MNESKDREGEFEEEVFRNGGLKGNRKSSEVQRRVALAESGGAEVYEYEESPQVDSIVSDIKHTVLGLTLCVRTFLPNGVFLRHSWF